MKSVIFLFCLFSIASLAEVSGEEVIKKYDLRGYQLLKVRHFQEAPQWASLYGSFAAYPGPDVAPNIRTFDPFSVVVSAVDNLKPVPNSTQTIAGIVFFNGLCSTALAQGFDNQSALVVNARLVERRLSSGAVITQLEAENCRRRFRGN